MRGDGPRELAQAIRSHADFVEAACGFTGDYLQWRGRLGVLNKVLSNLGRERLLEHTSYLRFSRGEPGNPHGATFERLAALSMARDDIGARAARTALRLAQTAGLLAPMRSLSDARLRIFEPTDALLAMTREVYVMAFGIFDHLAPGLGVSVAMRDRPEFLLEVLGRLGRSFLKARIRPHERVDVYNALLRLDGGRAVLTIAVDCHWRGEDLPTSQEIARQFYVSPSQIRAVIKHAEALGLMRTAKRGRLLDAARLAETHLDAMSRFLAVLASYGLRLSPQTFAARRLGDGSK